jgi:hypothetical protein
MCGLRNIGKEEKGKKRGRKESWNVIEGVNMFKVH